ncbi:small redox-active disulfide protein 2 [Caloramator fervidus]|uniref:Small redox-active disulfide protein 2 n=1 Tax=Caloramator fervidus TaxID=29344 RepID=A0A1H5TQI3_9CLOT|nr:thioredoxin family protein [Caloramator fervidus]SEF64257.1 small redox-active disulfide protein 2 [Caloramator fervidus]
MVIKILGSGCANCRKLEENTKKALEELQIQAEVVKVEDFKEIMKYGVMRTPALVVDEKVKSYGKVLTVEEVKKILQG